MIQIDQDSPPPSASRSSRDEFLESYSGQIAVFRAQDGRLVEQDTGGPLRSASHPGQFETRDPDTPSADNQDPSRGTPDIGILRPGVYEYSGRPRWIEDQEQYRFNPAEDSRMLVARDMNQDGVIDASEDDSSRYLNERARFATGLQIHPGGSRHPSSIGCQTLPPEDFDRFQETIGRSLREPLPGSYAAPPYETFSYILVRRPNDSDAGEAYRFPLPQPTQGWAIQPEGSFQIF